MFNFSKNSKSLQEGKVTFRTDMNTLDYLSAIARSHADYNLSNILKRLLYFCQLLSQYGVDPYKKADALKIIKLLEKENGEN